jgi:coenzyme PQQ precursor peptide PqqA
VQSFISTVIVQGPYRPRRRRSTTSRSAIADVRESVDDKVRFCYRDVAGSPAGAFLRNDKSEETTMAWTRPTLREICIGMEINGYFAGKL